MLIQGNQGAHESFKRNIPQLVMPDLGNLGLSHAGQGGDFSLCKATLINEVVEFDGQLRAGRQVGGIFKVEVTQNV